MSRTPIPQTIVVTGASAGVGRAVALAFARRGCSVALLARGKNGLMAAAHEVERAGGRALKLEVDVSDAEAVFAAAHEAELELGPIDVWVNNAMTTVFGTNESIAPEEFRRVMDVTFMGYVHGTLAALRYMRPRNRGVIVQVGSALAYRAIPLQGPYCAAKFAIRGFTDSLRSELLHDRSAIKITNVHLPAVNTPQFDWSRSKIGRRHKPLGDIYDPNDIAEAIYKAAGNPAREYWIGWSTTKAVLGSMMAPEYLDNYLADAGYEQVTRLPAPMDDTLFSPVGKDAGVRGTHGPGLHSPFAFDPSLLRMGAGVAVGALAVAGSLALASLGALRARTPRLR